MGQPQVARADEPTLAIWLDYAETEFYPISEIQRIGFEDDTLVVVGTAGSDRYCAESVHRIEFLWDVTSIHDPRDAATFLKVARLFQNRPNPFSPETGIDFELPQAGHAELRVYGVDGRLILTLVDDTQEAGSHSVIWDGIDDAGQRVPGGIYFYQLIAPGVEESRRMILLP
jgi:hypothetical protein